MKMAMTALAVVFLAGAAPAMAAPGEEDAPTRAEQNVDHPHFEERQRGGGQRDSVQRDAGQRESAPRDDAAVRERRDYDRVREAPRPPEPPRAVEPPRAAETPRTDRGRVPGDSIGRPGPWSGDDPVRGDDRRDGVRGDRGDVARHEGDRRDGDRRDRDRRDWDRHGDERRAGDDGRNRGRHDWDRHDGDRRGERRAWQYGHYPNVYSSSQRYHYRQWRPPVGYYVRIWSFGDFLPRSWYGSDYYITDPWNFDLPLAPPGYDWIRVGDDALLVDRYTGRVVQVVRDLFW